MLLSDHAPSAACILYLQGSSALRAGWLSQARHADQSRAWLFFCFSAELAVPLTLHLADHLVEPASEGHVSFSGVAM